MIWKGGQGGMEENAASTGFRSRYFLSFGGDGLQFGSGWVIWPLTLLVLFRAKLLLLNWFKEQPSVFRSGKLLIKKDTPVAVLVLKTDFCRLLKYQYQINVNISAYT